MLKYQRIIAPTARFPIQPNSGANLGNRLYTVDYFMDSFNKQVKPEFEKNGYITENRLSEIYSELLEGLTVKLSKVPRSQKGKADGRVKQITKIEKNNWMILGYNVQLPFSQKKRERVIKASKAEQLFHETSHLLQFVFVPKIPLKTTLTRETLFNRDAVWDFQRDFIYTSRALKEQIKNGEDYKPIVRNGLKEFFEHANPWQKIEILQNYRHVMLTEKTATRHGVVYRGDFDTHPDIIELKKEDRISSEKKAEVLEQAFENWKGLQGADADEASEEYYQFDGKTKIIERMLKAELKKVRAGFRATNKVTNPFSQVAK